MNNPQSAPQLPPPVYTTSPTQSAPIKNKTSLLPLILTGLLIGLIVIGVLTNGFGLLKKQQPLISIDVTGAPMLGQESATVTIIEFSDFSCPFCAAAAGYNEQAIASLKRNDPSWVAPLPRIKEEYVNTGKVKLIYKYMSGHGTGQPAQLIGWCLQDQGKFWEFYNKAFEFQEDTDNLPKMRTLAQDVSANMTQLDDCLRQNKYHYRLKNDSAQGADAGLTGTPSYIIGETIIEGAQSYNVFKKAIDAALQAA